jgi:hypothetical protein
LGLTIPHLKNGASFKAVYNVSDWDSSFETENLHGIYILFIYRSPIGNFNAFVTQLDKIMQKLCTIKSNLIICGDVNVNYLQESNKKSQLNAFLNSCNLFSIVVSYQNLQKLYFNY